MKNQKTNFLVPQCLSALVPAFTLAEVLITLAIIGVVAAMTIPTLISGYKKSVVEVKLSKFNAMMTQVVKLSTIDNGDTSTWDISDNETFYNKYLAPYLKVASTEKVDDIHFNIYMQDGTAFQLEKQSTLHMYFYPDAHTISNNETTNAGINTFVFLFYPKSGVKLQHPNFCNSPFLGDGTGFVPYFYYDSIENDYWDYENNCRVVVYPTDENLRDVLINESRYGCSASGKSGGGGAYCTKLIQMNGWKIPKDYPIEF